VLLPAIRSWHNRYPNVTVRLREFRSRYALQEAVRLGTADIAIGVRPDDWSGVQRLLGTIHFVVVLPAKDASLSRPGPVRLDHFAHRQWVLYDRAYGLADLCDAVFDIATFRPTAAVETSQAEAAARLAAAGLGPALVPLGNVPPELVKMSRRFEPAVGYEVYAFARRRWSASARAFLEIVAEKTWPPIPAGAHMINLPPL
jgi:DNA-binding transcriptional LysR family regulator